MEKLNKEQLLMVCGGLSISATLINSLARGINTLLNLGRSLGSAIRRVTEKNICPL
ncbi:MAG: hypothetical protein PHE54_02745 [Bacilli bacterium]|nr:hypothetical protein [Bacilli bacterium]